MGTDRDVEAVVDQAATDRYPKPSPSRRPDDRLEM